jgi:hypothetical protein
MQHFFLLLPEDSGASSLSAILEKLLLNCKKVKKNIEGMHDKTSQKSKYSNTAIWSLSQSSLFLFCH